MIVSDAFTKRNKERTMRAEVRAARIAFYSNSAGTVP